MRSNVSYNFNKIFYGHNTIDTHCLYVSDMQKLHYVCVRCATHKNIKGELHMSDVYKKGMMLILLTAQKRKIESVTM